LFLIVVRVEVLFSVDFNLS